MTADMKALKGLEKGQWELRERGGSPARGNAARSAGGRGDTVRRLCLGNPVQLMQLGHGSAACDHFIIQDTPERAAVSYQCRNNGTGRTDLRVETPRLVQIDAQGVANGAPFSLALEGRRVGICR